jgi:hypothetical protein
MAVSGLLVSPWFWAGGLVSVALWAALYLWLTEVA